MFFLKRFFVCVFCCVWSPAFSILGDLNETFPSTDRSAVVQLAHGYSALQNTSTGTMLEFSAALANMKETIFFRSRLDHFDHDKFIDVGLQVRVLIQNEIHSPHSFLGSILRGASIIPLLSERLSLAYLDRHLAAGLGAEGTFAIPNAALAAASQAALNFLTGRIFQVELRSGQLDIHNSRLVSVASGLAVGFNIAGSSITDLAASSGTPLNGVLTAAHVLSGRDGSRFASYFVQTCHLDPRTGFPTGVAAMNGTGGVVDFLQNSPGSQKIERFHIRNKQNGFWHGISLDMAQPQYEDHEDCVIGIFEASSSPIVYNENCPVSFLHPSRIASTMRYFVAGYAPCEHRRSYPLDLSGPLFVMSGDSPPLVMGTGVTQHQAPATHGMSGGPFFQEAAGGGLNVFGVVSAGNVYGEQFASYWQ